MRGKCDRIAVGLIDHRDIRHRDIEGAAHHRRRRTEQPGLAIVDRADIIGADRVVDPPLVEIGDHRFLARGLAERRGIDECALLFVEADARIDLAHGTQHLRRRLPHPSANAEHRDRHHRRMEGDHGRRRWVQRHDIGRADVRHVGGSSGAWPERVFLIFPPVPPVILDRLMRMVVLEILVCVLDVVVVHHVGGIARDLADVAADCAIEICAVPRGEFRRLLPARQQIW
jgi:hypothetical protein